jgi:hypothetical protein
MVRGPTSPRTKFLRLFQKPEKHEIEPKRAWDVDSHVTANVRDKTVDVDLIYSVKALVINNGVTAPVCIGIGPIIAEAGPGPCD